VLSATHGDTLADTVVDGDVIIGNITPTWSRLAISIPASSVRNVLGIDNGELRPSWKTALDGTAPSSISAGAVGAAGTSLIFAHRDHTHASPATWAATAHNLLSTIHGDMTAASCSRGDLITGQGASPTWARLALSVPAANVLNVLGIANGETEPAWKTVLDATNPTTIAASSSVSPGTSLVFAHRDHQHDITLSPALLGVGTAQYRYIVTGATPFNPAYSTGYLAITTAKTLTVSDSTTLANASITLANTGSLTLPAEATTITGGGTLALAT
jgi:hypothetical protein